MLNSTATFQAAMQEYGLTPPKVIECGKMYRFPGVNKASSNRAGWCILFNDGQGGQFGDWSTGLCQNWFAKKSNPYRYHIRKSYCSPYSSPPQQGLSDVRTKQLHAAKTAKRIWQAALPALSNHPYLVKKSIPANNARCYHNQLVLTIVNIDNQLTSLQFISGNGDKRLLAGGRKQGCFIPINTINIPVQRIMICEGWATGCTLASDQPNSQVIAAIDAGNLKAVALLMRQHYPQHEMIIAGDDDRTTHGNPGKTKAKAAALASDAFLAFPVFPNNAPTHLSDFNDLANWLKGGQHE